MGSDSEDDEWCCTIAAGGYACRCAPAPTFAEANALQMLAADNARMCEIIIAADKLAKALALPADSYGERARAIRTALDAYKAKRNGD